MGNFKESLVTDMSVFFNPDELGEPLVLNGEQFNGVVDDDTLKKRIKTEYEGITVGDLLFFCRVSDLPGQWRPEMGVRFQREGGRVRIGTIFDVNSNAGVYEMILEFNEG